MLPLFSLLAIYFATLLSPPLLIFHAYCSDLLISCHCCFRRHIYCHAAAISLSFIDIYIRWLSFLSLPFLFFFAFAVIDDWFSMIYWLRRRQLPLYWWLFDAAFQLWFLRYYYFWCHFTLIHCHYYLFSRLITLRRCFMMPLIFIYAIDVSFRHCRHYSMPFITPLTPNRYFVFIFVINTLIFVFAAYTVPVYIDGHITRFRIRQIDTFSSLLAVIYCAEMARMPWQPRWATEYCWCHWFSRLMCIIYYYIAIIFTLLILLRWLAH